MKAIGKAKQNYLSWISKSELLQPS